MNLPKLTNNLRGRHKGKACGAKLRRLSLYCALIIGVLKEHVLWFCKESVFNACFLVFRRPRTS